MTEYKKLECLLDDDDDDEVLVEKMAPKIRIHIQE